MGIGMGGGAENWFVKELSRSLLISIFLFPVTPTQMVGILMQEVGMAPHTLEGW